MDGGHNHHCSSSMWSDELCMQVGCAVDPKYVIVLVSTFARTYEDIKANGSEFNRGFTGWSLFLVPVCYTI